MFNGELQNVPFDGSECLKTIHRVMSLNVALTVAKIYDGRGHVLERKALGVAGRVVG